MFLFSVPTHPTPHVVVYFVLRSSGQYCMIAPKASFHVKVDAVNVFLQSPTIYTAKGPKNSHANSKHLIMVCVKWSLFMPMTTNGKSAKSPVVIITCPTKDSKANKAEKTVNDIQLRFSPR